MLMANVAILSHIISCNNESVPAPSGNTDPLLPPEAVEGAPSITVSEEAMLLYPASVSIPSVLEFSVRGLEDDEEIPSCLSFLRKLEILGLDGNCLTGNLPLFLRDMPALYNFGFSHCAPRVSPPVDTFPASFVLL